MSDGSRKTVPAGAENLLTHIRQQGRDRCEVEELRAQERARAIVAESRQAARRLVQTAVEAERRRIARQTQEAESRGRAWIRRTRYRQVFATLDRALASLDERLARLWANPESRKAWIANLAEQARTVLPAGQWTVEHPADFDRRDWDECDRRGRAACADDGPKPDFAADDGLRAGLRIRCGAALVDGSLEAMISRRTHVQSLILGALNDTRGRAADDGRQDRDHVEE